LRLIFGLPPGSAAVSGGNIYNAELVRALGRTHEVAISNLEACGRELAAGVPGVYFVDTLELGESLARPPRAEGQTLVLIVHHLPSLEPGLAAGDPALCVEAEALPRFDLYVVTSSFTAEHLAGRGIARTRILLVPPGLPGVTCTPRAYAPPLHALLVGNLIRRKCQLEFLSALDERLLDIDRWTLDLVGRSDLDGDYAQACRALVSGSPRLHAAVRLHEAVPYAEMARFYDGAGLLVSAAGMETFGMAIAEARAHGLPILALDRGYVGRHVRNGDSGLLFTELEALADGFIALVRDERAMRELFVRAQAGAATAAESWSAAAGQLEAGLARFRSRDPW
jgi:glycosyltransferase involved in cell wall biosynthesis